MWHPYWTGMIECSWKWRDTKINCFRERAVVVGRLKRFGMSSSALLNFCRIYGREHIAWFGNKCLGMKSYRTSQMLPGDPHHQWPPHHERDLQEELPEMASWYHQIPRLPWPRSYLATSIGNEVQEPENMTFKFNSSFPSIIWLLSTVQL